MTANKNWGQDGLEALILRGIAVEWVVENGRGANDGK